MTRVTRTDEILKRLRAAGSAANVAGMARYGIRPAKAYGVATPVTRAIAKELGRDTELASALWSTNVLEARMLAAWREAAQAPAGFWDTRLLVRGLIVAAALMVLSLWPAVQSQSVTPDSDYQQLADATVQVDDSP